MTISLSAPKPYRPAIEGTITPIPFVYEVLLPYARQQVGAFLEAHWSHPEVQKEVAELADPPPSTPQEAIDKVLQWMDQDRKRGALKSLQGCVWHRFDLAAGRRIQCIRLFQDTTGPAWALADNHA